MRPPPKTQDPNAKLNWAFDWTKWLAEAGSTAITESTWSVVPTATVSQDAITNAGKKTQVTLSGIQDGRSYRLTNHVKSNDGLEDECSYFIRAVQQ